MGKNKAVSKEVLEHYGVTETDLGSLDYWKKIALTQGSAVAQAKHDLASTRLELIAYRRVLYALAEKYGLDVDEIVEKGKTNVFTSGRSLEQTVHESRADAAKKGRNYIEVKSR